MKKSIKRATSLVMALAVSAGMTACGGGGGTSGKDYGDTTVLKILAHPGGPGVDYFNEASSVYGGKSIVQAFEEKYADVSFEEGKKGVKVDIQAADSLQDAYVKSQINSGNGADVYYSWARSEKTMAKEGIYANVTDIMTEKVYTADGKLAEGTYDPVTKKYTWTGEQPTLSMADKMTNYKDELYLEDPSGTLYANGEGYYSVPYEDSLAGFIVDYDLFKEQGWNDYEGIDGLPDTMEDFFDLIGRILDVGMVPFTTCEGTSGYWLAFYNAFMYQYEGEQIESGWTYSGDVTFPKSAFEGTSVNPAEEGMRETDDGESYVVTITPRNVWLMNYLPGVTKCIEFVRDIIQQDNMNYQVYNTQYDYLTCQQTFIMSKTGRVQRTSRIAMIFEGEWWENESKSVFTETNGGAYGTRDFRFMPTPKIDGQKDESVRTMAGTMKGSNLFVNAKSSKKDIARLWIQFTHSNEGLATYNMLTGQGRPFTYSIDDTQLSQMTKFAQNCYKIHNGVGEYSKITIYTDKSIGDGCEYYQNKRLGGFGDKSFYSSLISGSGYDQLSAFFKNHSKSDYVTAAQFIAGMREFNSKSSWESQYDSWVSLKG